MYKEKDKVCFIGGQSLPQYFGGVYEVIGQTIYGIFNDEYVLNDAGRSRRVNCSSIRHATPEEIAVGHRIDHVDDSHIESHVSPLCKMGVK